MKLSLPCWGVPDFPILMNRSLWKQVGQAGLTQIPTFIFMTHSFDVYCRNCQSASPCMLYFSLEKSMVIECLQNLHAPLSHICWSLSGKCGHLNPNFVHSINKIFCLFVCFHNATSELVGWEFFSLYWSCSFHGWIPKWGGKKNHISLLSCSFCNSSKWNKPSRTRGM